MGARSRHSKSLLNPTILLLVSSLALFSACNTLVVRPDDSGVVATGKYISRGVLFIPTFGASERRISRHRNSVPITDGFHARISPTTATIVVVGNNNSANNAAIIWLQKRGVSIVERTQLDKIFVEQQVRLMHSSDEAGMLLPRRIRDGIYRKFHNSRFNPVS